MYISRIFAKISINDLLIDQYFSITLLSGHENNINLAPYSPHPKVRFADTAFNVNTP